MFEERGLYLKWGRVLGGANFGAELLGCCYDGAPPTAHPSGSGAKLLSPNSAAHPTAISTGQNRHPVTSKNPLAAPYQPTSRERSGSTLKSADGILVSLSLYQIRTKLWNEPEPAERLEPAREAPLDFRVGGPAREGACMAFGDRVDVRSSSPRPSPLDDTLPSPLYLKQRQAHILSNFLLPDTRESSRNNHA